MQVYNSGGAAGVLFYVYEQRGALILRYKDTKLIYSRYNSVGMRNCGRSLWSHYSRIQEIQCEQPREVIFVIMITWTVQLFFFLLLLLTINVKCCRKKLWKCCQNFNDLRKNYDESHRLPDFFQTTFFGWIFLVAQPSCEDGCNVT